MSAMMLGPRQFFVAATLSLLLLGGCDDSDSSGGPADSGDEEEDSSAGRDSGTGRDSGLDSAAPEPDSGDEPDGDIDAGEEPPEALTQVFAGKTPLSTTQADRFWVVKFGADGKVYGAGFVTEEVSAGVLDRKFAVARFTTAGALDETFGDVDPQDSTKRTGIATVNVLAATAASDDEAVKGLAFQDDGKIIIAGPVETGKVSATLPLADGGMIGPADYAELDVALARLTTSGELDTTFSASDADAKPGILQFNLGDVMVTLNGAGTAASVTNDDVGDVQVDSEDRIVLFARGRAEAARTDTDRIIMRFLKDGAPDTGFGSAGRFAFSTEPNKNNDNARTGAILPGNEIVSAGYTNISGNHIVLVRLNADGEPVDSFGEDGAVIINPFKDTTTPSAGGFVEAYGAARQSDGSFVTTGYGRVAASEPANSLLSCRFSATGELDQNWGEANGCYQLDVLKDASGAGVGAEQGRNIAALPDDRIIMVGNGTVTTGNVDGIVVVLKKDGGADTGFFEVGHEVYDFGQPSDGLWGVAVSQDGKHVAVSGYAGQANNAAAADKAMEDAALVIYKIGD
jgi:uncharacterized delta-60 repeat protein